MAADTSRALAAFLQRFEDQVDPDRRLPDDRRTALAKAARTAYFRELSAISHKLARTEGDEHARLRLELRTLLEHADVRAMVVAALADGQVSA